MGCSYETAKQTICINEIVSTTATPTTTTTSNLINVKTRNCNKISEQQKHFQSSNSKLKQQHSIRNYSNNNDDCQLVRVQQPHQQQQQQLTPTTNKISTTKSNKTSTTPTATISKKIYKLNNENNISTSDNSNKKDILEIQHFSLVAKKYISRGNYTVPQKKTIVDDKTEEEINVSALCESCINCYPLACHNRFRWAEQQTQLVADEITKHTRQTLKPSTYTKDNNNNTNKCNNNCASSKSYSSNCNYNNYCRCHLSFFSPKHTKNTLNNEQECEPQLCQCNCVASQNSDFATFANAHPANGDCWQKTISHARTSLTENAFELKNNLMKVMANCATVAESLMGVKNTMFIKSYLNSGIASKTTNRTNSNNNNNNNFNNTNTKNKNNHNKSEPYRGYCRHVNHLHNKTNYTSYTSSTISKTLNSTISTSATNSCSLHNAISSNRRCNNLNHDDMHNNSNTISCSKSNSHNNGKRFNRNYGSSSRSSSSNNHNHNCQASPSSSSQTAAFNYIGQNYYSFLRNTINFYTASSVILVLCYLTSTTSAATTKADTTSIDKHPIRGIDWSKFDESSSDKEILDLLLEKKRYDKRLLPPVNGTLTVNVNVLLLSLASPDESSLKYEVEFLLNQQWNDPRLQYGNKSHYDFLNALHHHDSIWTPDTYFIMHGDFKDPIIPMHFALRIYRNGTITYAMRRHLILSCQGSLHIFPFDDPKCSFSMESISYEEAQIKYIWKNDEDTLRKSPSLTTLNAYLIKNQTTACDQNSWRGNYSCLQVELTFTRDRAYYFTTVFIPGIILVTSSFITFWLEWNAVPARVMIGVTTMLNFFTTSNGFRSTLPVVSNLTAMNVWDGVCMCFIYASLLEFVCVNYMGRKRPQHNVVYRPGENPVTQRLPAVLSRIGVILASPLEIIEREFHAALSSEKAATGVSSAGTSMGTTPQLATPRSEPLQRVHFYQDPSGGIIATAVQNLRSRSMKRRTNVDQSGEFVTKEISRHIYEHVYTEPGGATTFSAVPAITTTTVTIESDDTADNVVESAKLRRTQSMSTNTPPLICKTDIQADTVNLGTKPETQPVAEPEPKSKATDIEQMPVKPPRKKTSRSTSPSTQYEALQREMAEMMEIAGTSHFGEKKRDGGGPNEIVACTTCGGSSGSPCTHSVNNGCATETCFVQVRKKDPPHPIRIAKTIDVIARITFPTAYFIFLIFFFVHYKGFS